MERGRGKKLELDRGGREQDRGGWDKRNRGERENRFPKDLYAISENCRGSSVKPIFPVDLKPK
jgi:broad specificity phosphatase PhoE